MAVTLRFLRLPTVYSKKSSPINAIPSSDSKHPLKLTATTRASTKFDLHHFLHESSLHLRSASFPGLIAASTAVPFLLDTKEAMAVAGKFGILEGKTFALIHPAVMGGLFLYTLWAGYLGWQWRRVRTLQNEINELKKTVTLPPISAPVAVGVSSDRSRTPAATVPTPPPSAVELKIQHLTEERKKLVKGSYRDRHFNAGSILLGFGVLESVGGGLNSWIRTGKLFPGPHLFAGAAITVLWAAAAALVPAMQKGNETARNLHIGLSALNVALFVWQILTGFDIVLKVLSVH